MICRFCKEPLDPNRCYHRIQGWERKSRAAGRKSGSDIVLREATGEVACEPCIWKAKAGIATLQMEMG